MKSILNILKMLGYFLGVLLLTILLNESYYAADNLIAYIKGRDVFVVYPEKIDIYGNHRLSNQKVLQLAGIEKPVNFHDIDTSKLENNLKKNSGWVKGAWVQKSYPDYVKITVEEHVPQIIVNSRKSREGREYNSLWLADGTGRLFMRAEASTYTENLPVLFFDYVSGDEEHQKENMIAREKNIKDALMIVSIWKEFSPECDLETMSFEALQGYSVRCRKGEKLTTEVILRDDRTVDDWRRMIKKFKETSGLLYGQNKWAGEFIFDDADNTDGFRAYLGKVVQNVSKKGEI